MFTGSGNAHIKQSTFFLDLRVPCLDRMGNRHGPINQPDQEHCIPLQAFRRMQRGQCHPLHGGWMLRLGALPQLHQHTTQVNVWRGGAQFLNQIHQRLQRLPPLPSLRAFRLRGGQP